ncbi:MAG: iron ABC transporter permease [Pseudomonadota bacterium]
MTAVDAPMRSPDRARATRALVLATVLIVLLIGTGMAALTIGITQIPARDVPMILFTEGGERIHRIVVWQVRMPRFLVGALGGASLAVAGALLQDALRNPLAEPGLLGVSSGASLVVATIVIFGIPIAAGTLPLYAFAGGMSAGIFILFATRIVRDPVRMILMGAALAAFFSALITVIVILGRPDQVRALYAWLSGSLIGRDWDHFALLWPWSLVTIPAAMFLARPLNLLRLGDEMAEGLGLPVFRTQALIFFMAILLVAPVVSVAGPVGFVALIAPHMVRGALGTGNAVVVLPISALMGAVLLTMADFAAREVLRPAELPVGLIVTSIGAPVALYFLRKLGKRRP